MQNPYQPDFPEILFEWAVTIAFALVFVIALSSAFS